VILMKWIGVALQAQEGELTSRQGEGIPVDDPHRRPRVTRCPGNTASCPFQFAAGGPGNEVLGTERTKEVLILVWPGIVP